MRGFLKWLGLVLLLAYAQLFTLVWLNAYTFGYEATVYVNEWGEGNVEGLLLFGVLWPVATVGLYFLAVDGGVFGGE